ncbi:MAG: potassium/proton antiporter [Succinivibrio sp.]|nr:potassium/proton antiporter [Succinivibrio sp.]
MENLDLNYIFFIAGVLLTFAVLASKLSSVMGTPLLLLFLGIGMLSGEDGFFIHIVYNDYSSAFFIANFMLALILLDGGLRTSWPMMRSVISQSVVLATFGVLLTSAITGLAAYLILDLGLMQCMLIGAIVGSTDAAAVFSLLGDGGVHLKEHVSSTLQIESATNDPMAILLTTVLLALVSGSATSWVDIVLMFFMQFGLGAMLGIIFGLFARMVISTITLGAGLYSLLVIGLGLIGFAVTAALGGSGFLAIFIIGMFVGNQKVRQLSYVLPVGEGFTWMAQITLFLMLGLLVSPRAMVQYALPGVVVALAMTFVARPLAVFLCVRPFYRSFTNRDLAFMSWVGLRGSVPIVLAIYPVMDDVTNAQLYFNVAFVVVLVSLLIQGATIVPMAKLFRVYAPSTAAPMNKAEVGISLSNDYELFNYSVRRQNLDGVALRSISFPKRTAVAAVFRDGHLLKAQGSTKLQTDDIVSIIGTDSDEPLLNSIFSQKSKPKQHRLYNGDKIFPGTMKMSELANLFGIELTGFERNMTLADFMSYHIGGFPQPGDFISLINATLVVVELEGDRVGSVGLNVVEDRRKKFAEEQRKRKLEREEKDAAAAQVVS